MLLHDLAEHTGELAACPAPQPGAFRIGSMDANDTLSLAGTEAAHKQAEGPAVPRKPEITARQTTVPRISVTTYKSTSGIPT
jgi:hypothetical protein